MIYPSKLDKGDIIEIISPSNGIKNSKLIKFEKAINSLKDYGFNIKEDEFVRNSINGASSSAKNRANAFNKAITNKDTKMLLACSGGDYIIQMLNYVKFPTIKENIKWIQGHSDITSLLYYITTKYDIATIYSFNAKTFGNELVPKTMIENNLKILQKEQIIQKEYGYELKDEKKQSNWACITNFTPIKGRIIGGCLDSLKDIIGTKYDNTKKFIEKYKDDGIIWYFDVAEMTNEDILRTMWQLKEAKWFNYTKAILFGRLYEEITYTNTTLEDAIKYNLESLNIPIIINADIGHTDPVITILNGSIVKIEKKDVFELETIYE